MRIAGSTLIALVLLVMTGLVLADAPAAPAARPAEQFLVKALQTSMMEVELGKLAQQNAQSTGVNALGARLQRDHARIGRMLTAAAREKGVVVPTSLETAQRAEVDALRAVSRAEFDSAYVELMVRNHENAIALYTAVAESGDAAFSPLAKLALPTLREDQRLARSYEKLNPGGADVQPVASRQ